MQIEKYNLVLNYTESISKLIMIGRDKMNKILKSICILGIAFSSVTVAANNNSLVAEASVVEKKEFPKSFQRTWYAYNKNEKKYEKITFHKGAKISSRECYNGKCFISKPSRMKIFYYTDIHNGLWNVKGINQTAGAGMYYKVGTKKINGKKYKVLKEYSGAWAEFNRYYFTKKIK